MAKGKVSGASKIHYGCGKPKLGLGQVVTRLNRRDRKGGNQIWLSEGFVGGQKGLMRLAARWEWLVWVLVGRGRAYKFDDGQ